MRLFTNAMMKSNIFIIHPSDNVGIALKSLNSKDRISNGEEVLFDAGEPIPVFHKVALQDIAVGEEIYKYGAVIAVSSKPIKKGDWVHTHNLEGARWHK
jgi:altronate dehydratase